MDSNGKLAVPKENWSEEDACKAMLDFLKGGAPEIHGKEDLLAVLREAIASGALSVGARLPNERQLAQTTGMSRSSVRVALDRLVAEGRLVRQVGRGTFVVDPDARKPGDDSGWVPTPAEILAARAVVEPALPAMIVMNASDAELAEILTFVRDGRAVEHWKQAEYMDAGFHQLLFKASRNGLLREFGERVAEARHGQAWTQVKQRSFDAEKWRIYQTEHEEIAQALVDRDQERASQLLRDHLAGVRIRMRAR